MDRRLFLKRGAASLSVPAVLAGMSQAKAEECAAIQLALFIDSPCGNGTPRHCFIYGMLSANRTIKVHKRCLDWGLTALRARCMRATKTRVISLYQRRP